MVTIDELTKTLGISKKTAKEIDKGMWDILFELNKKGYKTVCCCEGHVNDEKRWNAYLFFARDRVPKTLPPLYDLSNKKILGRYSQVNKNGNIFYWYGSNSKKLTLEQKEEERLQLLKDLEEWAMQLPNRELKKKKLYGVYLDGEMLKTANSEEEAKNVVDRFKKSKVLSKTDAERLVIKLYKEWEE